MSWDDLFHFDQNSFSEVQWWVSCPSSLPPISFHPFSSKCTLYTDASLFGWGGYIENGFSCAGVWEKNCKHINTLELQAIFNSVQSLLPHLKNKSVTIFCDNICAVYYVNKFGGTQSLPMCLLSLKLWKLLNENNISYKAFHLPGISNTHADLLSRTAKDESDYSLSHCAFDKLKKILNFKLNVDLFASKFSFKLDFYVSFSYDEKAWRTNAFSFVWPDHCYIFPPINILSKVITKFKFDKVKSSVLLTPAWKSLNVLPSILELLFDKPIFIPSHCIEGQLPTRHQFNVMAWPISCCSAQRMGFHQNLLKPSLNASPQVPFKVIKGFGNIFIPGLPNQKAPLSFQSL